MKTLWVVFFISFIAIMSAGANMYQSDVDSGVIRNPYEYINISLNNTTTEFKYESATNETNNSMFHFTNIIRKGMEFYTYSVVEFAKASFEIGYNSKGRYSTKMFLKLIGVILFIIITILLAILFGTLYMFIVYILKKITKNKKRGN